MVYRLSHTGWPQTRSENFLARPPLISQPISKLWGPRLFLETTWALDSGNYTFSCSLAQRNMSSNRPPNVPSSPNSDGDKLAHLSAISRNLFTFSASKGREREVRQCREGEGERGEEKGGEICASMFWQRGVRVHMLNKLVCILRRGVAG